MRITFVTGASGAGKTTLHDLLMADPEPDKATMVYELDSYDMPQAGHVDWLRWRAAEALQGAIEAAQANHPDELRHIIVSGIVGPFSLIGQPVWREAMEWGITVRFVCLDRPWHDTAAALYERLADWEPDDRSEQIENNRRLARQLRTEVAAVRGGALVTDGELATAASLVLDTSW
jgi:hypothetical protein